MKMFQKAPLALAVSALMMAPVAFAENGNGNGIDAESSIESTFVNNIDVDLRHKSYTRKDFDIDVSVSDEAEHYSGATVDSKQFTADNEVTNKASENNATVGSNTGANATGNVGINVAAGDNNAQANDAALATSDAMDVFGQSAAYSAQHAGGNAATNAGSPNNAVLGSGALYGSSGNITANVVAGSGNAQQNSLAASSNNNAGHTRATTGGVQQASGNSTTNKGLTQEFTDTVDVAVSGVMVGGYAGQGNGSYEGGWNQTNDVYPEVWGTGQGVETNHKEGGGAEYLGHIDFDNKSDSGQDGRFEGSESGELGFEEAGLMAMGGTLSGGVTTTNTVYISNENNATIGSNALQGASGNVGVNVAAGTNNLQRNSLSIASSMGGSPATPPNGGGTGE